MERLVRDPILYLDVAQSRSNAALEKFKDDDHLALLASIHSTLVSLLGLMVDCERERRGITPDDEIVQ